MAILLSEVWFARMVNRALLVSVPEGAEAVAAARPMGAGRLKARAGGMAHPLRHILDRTHVEVVALSSIAQVSFCIRLFIQCLAASPM